MSDVYVLELRDSKEKVQIRGHKCCIDNISEKTKKIDVSGKLSVQQVLKKLNIEMEGN